MYHGSRSEQHQSKSGKSSVYSHGGILTSSSPCLQSSSQLSKPSQLQMHNSRTAFVLLFNPKSSLPAQTQLPLDHLFSLSTYDQHAFLHHDRRPLRPLLALAASVPSKPVAPSRTIHAAPPFVQFGLPVTLRLRPQSLLSRAPGKTWTTLCRACTRSASNMAATRL
jgi:hypothetical protein